jgi:hypothetical protein
MTPVPTQPIRVAPGFTLAIAIALSLAAPVSRVIFDGFTQPSYERPPRYDRFAAACPIVLVHGFLGFDRIALGRYVG